MSLNWSSYRASVELVFMWIFVYEIFGFCWAHKILWISKIQRVHYCVWRKCCLLCKQLDSFCCPRKQVVILGDQVLSPIEIASWIIASGPRWQPNKILLVYQQCQIFCFSRFLICQSKGNSQSFMCYRLATTCIYVNSSFVEFSMVI